MMWHKSTLGKIIETDGGLIQTGPFGSQLHQYEYQSEGIPVIMPKDIIDGKVSQESIARISEQKANELSRHKLKPGTIVLPRRGEISKRAFITADQEGWLCGTGCVKIELSEINDLRPEFLYFFMEQEHVVKWLEQHAIGTTMLNLNTQIVGDLPVRFPDRQSQQTIVAALSTYNELIENNRRRIALLEKAARLLYEEWFVRFRFPGHERVKFVDGLPEGWFYQNPNEFLSNHIGGGWGSDFSNGKNIQPGFVIRGTDIPSVEQGDVASVQMRYHGIKQLESRKLLPYDIIFEVSGGSTTQPVARTLILTPERLKMFEGDVICASFCKRFSMRSPEDAVFFYYHIRDSRDRGGILVYQKESASALKNFNFESFMSQYKIPIPPEPIRKHFFEFSGSILKQQVALSSEISVLVAARNLLLPRLMSGEVEV